MISSQIRCIIQEVTKISIGEKSNDLVIQDKNHVHELASKQPTFPAFGEYRVLFCLYDLHTLTELLRYPVHP